MTSPSTKRRRILLETLGRVCKQIEGILAGQNLTLADVELPQERDPGPSPLERLRAFKALLSESLAELNAGQPRRCQGCEQELGAAELDEMPWAFRCASCSPDAAR